MTHSAPSTPTSRPCCTTLAGLLTPPAAPRRASGPLAGRCPSARLPWASPPPPPLSTALRSLRSSTPQAAKPMPHSCFTGRFAIFEQSYGPAHHEVGVTLGNLGAI